MESMCPKNHVTMEYGKRKENIVPERRIGCSDLNRDLYHNLHVVLYILQNIKWLFYIDQ